MQRLDKPGRADQIKLSIEDLLNRKIYINYFDCRCLEFFKIDII